MKIFELVIIGFMGICTVSLFAIGIQTSHNTVPHSPKANFFPIIIETKAVSNSMVPTFKINQPGRLKHLTFGSLAATFLSLDYDLETIRDEGASVPRIFVINMPKDMPHIELPAQRKRIFFKTVLPLILKVNDDVLKDRERLLRIKSEKVKTVELSAVDRLWLVALSERYFLERNNLPEMIRRVDIIPPSIALAQAAEESGWGTSRFALEGNALFGQWTFKAKNSLKPRDRDPDKTHNIRAYPTLLDAVRSYVLNLNTHRAYQEFRKGRQELRHTGQRLTGARLVNTLHRYSERGVKYVKTIQLIMSSNQLLNLDKARLGSKRVTGSDQPKT
jgi:Bax protein